MAALLSCVLPSGLETPHEGTERTQQRHGGAMGEHGQEYEPFLRGFTKNRRDGLCRTAKAAFLRIAISGVGCAPLGGVQSVTTQLRTGYIFISM